MFALSLPAILLFASFILDTANWWEHKRHLQMQADAAALAGAGVWSMPCDEQRIRDEIDTYAGHAGSVYNQQVGNAADRIEMAVNSKTWPGQTSPVDETVIEGNTCAAAMVDVKLTEMDTPWLFGLAPALGIDGPEFINARARASIVKVGTLGGALPLGIPDVNPKRGWVQFIDEATGDVLGDGEIIRVAEASTQSRWVLKEPSISIDVTSTVNDIGVRVILSGGTAVPQCGQPLVDCYDLGSANGLLHLRRIPSGGGNAAPRLGSVGLRASNCIDAYFTYSSETCMTGLSAEVDFGGSNTADPVGELGAKVTAVVGNKSYAASYDAVAGRWQLPAGNLIPIATGSGPVPIQLNWEHTKGTRPNPAGGEALACKTGGANPCKGSFGTVQRAFSGSDGRSGPIRSVKVHGASGFPLSDHSLAEGVHNLTVEVGLQGRLMDATAIDSPLVALRVGQDSGSNGQSLDCDTQLNQLVDEIDQGCGETYTVNDGTACPASGQELWTSWDQPWPCVRTQTGGPVAGQVGKGMNLRILDSEKPSTCTVPNEWETGFTEGFDKVDQTRIVPVFITPFGVFGAQGDTTVPVTGFATFYVTGWVGNPGFQNPCVADGTDEIVGAGEQGFIYGRFIKYVQQLPSGSGTEKCDPDSFGACTMVLTE